MALTTQLQIALSAVLTKTPGLTTASNPLLLSLFLNLGDGTGAGNADKMYTGRRTLTASSNEDLDLAGGVTDEFGATITMARVKMLYVRAAAANVNNVVVGAAAANPWVTLLNSTGTVTLRPDAGFLWFAGVGDATAAGVTVGTGDLLRVANSAGGTSVVYDIAVLGASV